jgi:hypothetical protein
MYDFWIWRIQHCSLYCSLLNRCSLYTVRLKTSIPVYERDFCCFYPVGSTCIIRRRDCKLLVIARSVKVGGSGVGVHGSEISLRDLFWEFGGEMFFQPICKVCGKAGDSEVTGGRVTSLAAVWVGFRDRADGTCNLKYPSHRHQVYVNEELCNFLFTFLFK